MSPSQAIPLRGPPAGAAGEIELKVDQAIALRTGGVDKGAANLLQGLDIDESLGLDQVDEQIRDYLSTKAVRVIDLFRQIDDDETGSISKKEFRKAMPALGLNVSKAQLDELFDMWDADKSGMIQIKEMEKLLRRGSTIELDAALQDGAAGEIEVSRDQNIALRTGKVDKNDSNILQGLDIDESLGLDQVDEQARLAQGSPCLSSSVGEPRSLHAAATLSGRCACTCRCATS